MRLSPGLWFGWLLACVGQAQTPAALSLAPAMLRFSTAAGSNPGALTVSVAPSAPTTAWTAAATAPWLSLSAATGTGAATISASADTAGMLPGIYCGAVQVTAGGATGTIPVTLAIAAVRGQPFLSGNQWYISAMGTPQGNGTVTSPWDLATGLNNTTVQPGDTVWVRGGHYGDGTASAIVTSSLVGTAAAPIVVRAYPGERVIIDAWLQVGCCDQGNNPALGSYTWFWGLEFAGYNTNRTSLTDGTQLNHAGADTWGDGTRFIDCILHDTAGGISAWDANDVQLYGNLIYNIGGYGPDRGHGHDFYLQNSAPSFLGVADNIAFNNFDEGVQAYGSEAADVENMTFAGNIVFNSGILDGTLVDNFTIGGGASNGGPSGMALDSNYTYDTPSLNQGQNEIGYLWTPVSNDAVVVNNYFAGGYQAVDLERWNTLTFENNTMYAAQGSQQSWLIYGSAQNPATYTYSNNTYYGADQFWIFSSCDVWPCPNGYQVLDDAQWQALDGLDAGSTFHAGAPGGIWTFVRPNLYEPGRANIAIYNWSGQPEVTLDVSASGIQPGDPFEIRDAENWFGGPVVSGTYHGGPVTIPMTGLEVAQPVGSVPYAPSHTAPQFGAFVLLSGDAYPRSAGGAAAPDPHR